MGVRRETGTADLLLFMVTVLLIGLGVVMVFSASSIRGYNVYGDPLYYLKRQLIWAAIGFVGMFTAMKIDYQVYRRLATPLLAVSLALLGLVLVVGSEVGGTKGWINLGFMSLQPSELTKLALIIYTASYLAGNQEKVKNFWGGVVLPLGWAGLAVVLVMLEPDFGAAIAFMALTVIQLFAAGVKVLHLGAVGLAGVPAFVYLAMSEPYRMRRLLAFINPWADPLNTGYQTIQSLLAIGSGGIFGLGLGQSRQKFAYLPENHTDFIFAILAEELGLLGTIFVLFLIFVFAWRGLRIAISAPDYFGSVLAVGVTSLIIFQALLNIAVISGSLPITGLTLPLISYGGSSLAITMAGVGILLNISKYSSPR